MAGSKHKKSQFDKIVEQAVNETGKDIYLYSGEISEPGYINLANEVVGHTDSNDAILILVTTGGSGNAAFKISRLFQNSYGDFQIFVPAYCRSAGTIVALGAHKILMTSMSELGPIDAQVLQKDEVGKMESSLHTRASLDALLEASFDFFESSTIHIVEKSQGSISFKLAAEISATMAAGMISPLISKIDLSVLGKNHRDNEESIKCGLLLAEVSENAKDGTVQKLTVDYPDHNFVIDRLQAEQLFHDVGEPSPTLTALAASPQMQMLYTQDGPPVVRSFRRPSASPSRDAASSTGTAGRQANDDLPLTDPDEAHQPQAA